MDYGELHLQFHWGCLRQGYRGRVSFAIHWVAFLLPPDSIFHCHIQILFGIPWKKKPPHNPIPNHVGIHHGLWQPWCTLTPRQARHPLWERDNNETSPRPHYSTVLKERVCVPCLGGKDLTGFLLLSLMYHWAMKFKEGSRQSQVTPTSDLRFIQKQVSVWNWTNIAEDGECYSFNTQVIHSEKHLYSWGKLDLSFSDCIRHLI